MSTSSGMNHQWLQCNATCYCLRAHSCSTVPLRVDTTSKILKFPPSHWSRSAGLCLTGRHWRAAIHKGCTNGRWWGLSRAWIMNYPIINISDEIEKSIQYEDIDIYIIYNLYCRYVYMICMTKLTWLSLSLAGMAPNRLKDQLSWTVWKPLATHGPWVPEQGFYNLCDSDSFHQYSGAANVLSRISRVGSGKAEFPLSGVPTETAWHFDNQASNPSFTWHSHICAPAACNKDSTWTIWTEILVSCQELKLI